MKKNKFKSLKITAYAHFILKEQAKTNSLNMSSWVSKLIENTIQPPDMAESERKNNERN